MDFILGFAHHETNCKVLLGFLNLRSSGNNSYKFLKIAKGMVSTWYIGLRGSIYHGQYTHSFRHFILSCAG